MAKGINKVKGCVKPPLFEIEPENCVIDELHLFLRISDVLFEILFAELQRLSHQLTGLVISGGSEPGQNVL